MLGVLGLLGVVIASAQSSVESFPDQPRFEHLTQKDGLSKNNVMCVLTDPWGFVWIGTTSGLNRYDGRDIRRYGQEILPSAFIRSLVSDHDGALWIGTQKGLARFDPVTEEFSVFRHEPGRPDSLSHDVVFAVHLGTEETPSPRGKQGGKTLWMGTMAGLDRFDRETGSFHHYDPEPSDPEDPIHQVRLIVEDHSGRLWLGAQGGLSFFDPGDGSFVNYRHDPDDPGSLSRDLVRALHLDENGILWVGTWERGLNRFDPATGTFGRYRHDPEDPRSLGHDTVMALGADAGGRMWIGTWGAGLARYDPGTDSFVSYRHDPVNAGSLVSDTVRSLYSDPSGLMWVGTWGDGVDTFDPFHEGFHRIRLELDASGDSVWGFYEDHTGTLWIGSENGLDRLSPDRKQLEHFRDEVAGSGRFPDFEGRIVWSILEDRRHTLWVGTHGAGLYRIERPHEPDHTRFVRYRSEAGRPDSLAFDEVSALLEDRAGHLWVGTWGGGLDRLEVSSRDLDPPRFQHFRHLSEDPRSLSGNIITVLFEDSGGSLWIGTWDGGLNRFEPETEQFSHSFKLPSETVTALHEDDAEALWIATWKGGLERLDRQRQTVEHVETAVLDDHIVLSILADSRHRLWFGTHRGVVRFDPATLQTTVYDTEDGLPDGGMTLGAAFRARDGTMYLGGGFYAFHPEKFHDNVHVPEVVITSFKVFDEERDLERAPFALEDVELPHRDNFFSFEFAALDFRRPEHNRYAYRLEGLDSTWIDAGHRREARYTSVPAGDYVFRVRGSNNDGLWNEDGARLRVRVRRPWWGTAWALAFYVVGVGALVGIYLVAQRRKLERERSIARRERAVSRRLHEVDRWKDAFLTNTSHELRTPLFGIIGLAETLRDGTAGAWPGDARQKLDAIVSSGRRLSSLVNDLLDFSKLKERRLELVPRPVVLGPVADTVLHLSAALAKGKDLELRNTIARDLPPVHADPNRVEQILLNLVGNAIKFTESGQVEIGAQQDGEEIVVRVSDTGSGIVKQDQERIFEAFEQATDVAVKALGGTGLGLAVSRRLVELHGGRMWVDSVPGEGSAFSFSLPVSQEPAAPTVAGGTPSVLEDSASAAAAGQPAPARPDVGPDESETASSGTTSILVVDDEPINRMVLRAQLESEDFKVFEAVDGLQALAVLDESPIDLALLDVMMPGMSGFEVCRRLRQTFPFDRLPVIFLTAKDTSEDRLTGFEAGGNDYLTKPSDWDELLARIRLHLRYTRQQ